MNEHDWREQNRRSWNVVVGVHNSHRRDQAAWLRDGGSTLFPEELALLGDVAGRTIAHLMCNAGQDSLSLARRGAIVTGVDLSDAAIDYARQLSAESGIGATFVRSDVYDWFAAANRSGARFDVVFGSYGMICWLPDLDRWAGAVATILQPGGRLVIIDFHPVANMFDAAWRHSRDYFAHGEVLPAPGVGDYVGASGGGLTPSGYDRGVQEFDNPEPCFLFRWGLGEIVTAIAGAGLIITALHEYPFTNGERPFADMQATDGRRMIPPPHVPRTPLMYGIAARAPD
jgi:SAM-dependent methyltransferase